MRFCSSWFQKRQQAGDFEPSGGRLGKLLGDAAGVSAMLDRLLHDGHLLKCGPRSWRTKTTLPETGQTG